MRLQSSEDESSLSSEEKGEVLQLENGYRLVDLKSFSSVLSALHNCDEGDLTIEENTVSRAGLIVNF